MVKHLVRVPIFGRHVFFVGDCSPDEDADAVYKLKGMGTRVEFTETANGGVRDSCGDVFVWVRDLDKASIVAHELVHAASSIMEECNIPLCRETEEVQCYLVEWLKINVQDKVYEKREKQKERSEK